MVTEIMISRVDFKFLDLLLRAVLIASGSHFSYIY